MSRRIIGNTVGTTISPNAIDRKIKPVKSVNGVAPDDNGNVEIPAGGGDAGVGIQDIVQWYYLSKYSDDYKGGSWSRVYPIWQEGKYLWTRQEITYTDGTSETTSPICVTGSKGATGSKGDKGDQGIQGEKGDKGDKGDSGVMTVNGITPDENGNVEIPTGGGSSGGCTKTLLWTSPYGGSGFYLSELYLPIAGYDAIEILYEDELSYKILSSSGEIQILDGYTASCNLFKKSGVFYTNITISSDGKFTFTFKDNEYCTPKFIYGIKYANPVVQSDNALASAGFQVNKAILSGDEEDYTGTDLTGYIKVAGGDVIRLKNVTMPDTDGLGNRINCYRGNQNLNKVISITSTDTDHSPVFENGNLVQFTILDGDIKESLGAKGWIRIGAENIDKYSIITVNKEIE